VVINVVNMVLLAAAISAFWLRRKDWLSLWPLWGTYLALLLFHAFSYMEPRYLFPARVVVAVMGAVALCRPAERLLSRFNRGATSPTPSSNRP
jgi:hypothetical protein